MRAGPPVRESGAERQRGARRGQWALRRLPAGSAAARDHFAQPPIAADHCATMADKALRYLDALQAKHPALAPCVGQLADLYRRKLWHQARPRSLLLRHSAWPEADCPRARHRSRRPCSAGGALFRRSRCSLSGCGAQLTAALEDCLALLELRQEGVLLPFYHSFVATFAHKLNPLRLAQLAVTVAQQGFAEPPRPLEAGARPLRPCSLRSLRQACARIWEKASTRVWLLCWPLCARVLLGGCTRRVEPGVRARSRVP